MTITTDSFRKQFKEFSDPSDYTDDDISTWLTISASMLDPVRWGTLFDLGASYFIAHNLVLSARDRKAVAFGGIPGAPTGVQSSKSVDKVSTSYDTKFIVADAGFWNTTSYGMRFYQYMQLIGAGGVQFGGASRSQVFPGGTYLQGGGGYGF